MLGAAPVSYEQTAEATQTLNLDFCCDTQMVDSEIWH